MSTTQAMRDLIKHLLQAVGLVATTSWAAYWFLMRVPEVDWRQFLVALLLAVVLGWWTWIAMGTTLVLAVCMVIWGPEPDLRVQMALEIVAFGAIGLLWGGLGRIMLQPHFLAPTPPQNPLPMAFRPEARPADPSQMRTAPAPMRSNRLMDGHFDESRSARNVPHKPAPLIPQAQPPQPPEKTPPAPMPFHPAATPSSSHLPVWDEPSTGDHVLPLPQLEPPGQPMPLRPTPEAASQPLQLRPGLAAPASLGDYGGESVYLPGLPSHADSIPDPPAPERPVLPSLPQMVTQEIRLGQLPPPRPPVPPPTVQPSIIGNESSVFLPSEFPTMEMPVASLLRSGGSSAGHVDSSALTDDPSGNDAQLRRSGLFQRPETQPGKSWEHLLEWYNQFSWSPWNAEELEKQHRRPGYHVGWEVLALQEVAKVWQIWRDGCTPLAVPEGTIHLHALEGFLRCEIQGVLRQQGFPDLHLLSKAPPGDAWLDVYREVRGRLRGGEAAVSSVAEGPLLVDDELQLCGRPDRLAQIRGESDVVALVTPFSVSEGLSWVSVYAVAQYRLAQKLGVALSEVPVVIHLPLPIWDERRVCRLNAVEDIGSELRRLEVALERFRRVLTGQAPPRPQTQQSTCSGCGWRHWCSAYGGNRPRLNLASPPPQLSAALR